jgi:ribosomal protein S1
MSSEVPSGAVDETPQESTEAEITPDMAVDETPQESTEAETAPATETTSPTGAVNSLEDITAKMKLSGTVRRTELQGAIIDVGLERDGLLHISQLSEEPVKNVTDVVKEGDAVTVYVLAIDKKSGRLDLTLVEPPDFTWNEIKVNQTHVGKVERIENYGVFVDIGAERPGLIHVSELTTDFVSDPNQVVKVGQTIEAKVIGVNKRKKQIDLSVKALEMEELDAAMEEDDGEPFATSMEMALRKALEGGEIEAVPEDAKERKRRKKDRKKAKYDAQQELFERTLRMHQNGQ